MLLFKFDHYRDTRAFILDPCIQGILQMKKCVAGDIISKTIVCLYIDTIY